VIGGDSWVGANISLAEIEYKIMKPKRRKCFPIRFYSLGNGFW
jgi:hypothetical protein